MSSLTRIRRQFTMARKQLRATQQAIDADDETEAFRQLGFARGTVNEIGWTLLKYYDEKGIVADADRH